MSLELFTEKYKSFLEVETSNLLITADKLKAENREDEYRFNRIENNILEIFTQMFDISIKKTLTSSDWKKDLERTYLSFFNKIPSSWHVNLQKCKEHGLEEEVYIETLKIKRANAIKDVFENMLEEEKV